MSSGSAGWPAASRRWQQAFAVNSLASWRRLQAQNAAQRSRAPAVPCTLTCTIAHAHHTRVGPPRPQDVNCDGQIDYSEFVAATLHTAVCLQEDNLVMAFKVRPAHCLDATLLGRGAPSPLLGSKGRVRGPSAGIHLRAVIHQLSCSAACTWHAVWRPLTLLLFASALKDAPTLTKPAHAHPQHFDLDGDGRITREELEQALAAMGRLGSNAAEIIASVDQNGDGVVDYLEFVDMMSCKHAKDGLAKAAGLGAGGGSGGSEAEQQQARPREGVGGVQGPSTPDTVDVGPAAALAGGGAKQVAV